MYSKKMQAHICDSMVRFDDDFEVGSIIWAKFSANTWYPGIVVNPTQVYQQPIKGKIIVLWCYDHLISHVFIKNVCSFKENYALMHTVNAHCGESWFQAVKEALRELATATNAVRKVKHVLRWALQDFPGYQARTKRVPPFMLESFLNIRRKTFPEEGIGSSDRNATTPIPSKKQRINSDIRIVNNTAKEVTGPSQNTLSKANEAVRSDKSATTTSTSSKKRKIKSSTQRIVKPASQDVPDSMPGPSQNTHSNTNENAVVGGEKRAITTATSSRKKRMKSSYQRIVNRAAKERIKAAHQNKHAITFCLACFEDTAQYEHPVFEGGLCLGCKERLVGTLRNVGQDGIAYNCVICVLPGEMVVCDEVRCSKVYCDVCLKYLAAPDARTNLTQIERWSCFVCTGITTLNGLLIPRGNFMDKIYDLTFDVDLPVVKKVPKPDKMQKIRVLFILNGIEKALVVLKNLKLDVEIYYSSAIEANKKNITIASFGNKIKYLGDISKITAESIEAISPLHLIIGASQNEVSGATPNRKGLSDLNISGPYFFEFVRILNSASKLNPNGIYWLFSNKASMSPDAEITISSHLQCAPVCLDSSRSISPQQRAKYFWGNCSTLKSDLFTSKKLQLQGLCDRLRTLTQDSNRDTNEGSQNEETLWTTELEKLLGFSVNCSDAGNLSNSDRLKALEQAWDLGILQYILGFLTDLCGHKSNQYTHGSTSLYQGQTRIPGRPPRAVTSQQEAVSALTQPTT